MVANQCNNGKKEDDAELINNGMLAKKYLEMFLDYYDGENVNQEICGFSDRNYKYYVQLFEKFIKTNNNDNFSKEEKGDALEDLTFHLLKSTGLFEVYKNLHSSTNEVDVLFILNDKAKPLQKSGILNFEWQEFISECKNHKGSVSVTYVGKFYSLLNTMNINLGIMFSYNGLSGNKWNNAEGLRRKMYFKKEKLKEKTIILSFDKNDFELLLDKNNNFINIINKKLLALKTDIDFSEYIKEHPAEKKIKGK